MNALEKYAQENLIKEIKEISNTPIADFKAGITVYEKAYIYKYSTDLYREINIELRNSNGIGKSELSKYTVRTLKKIKNIYAGVVYRGVNLTDTQIDVYRKAYKNKTVVKEQFIISTSKSPGVAKAFMGNCFFEIVTNNGKDIEPIAKFGENGYPNEQEVLLLPNTQFNILRVTIKQGITFITMQQL